MYVPERQRKAALHMLNTRQPDAVYQGVTEPIIYCMTADQIQEYIIFMANQPQKTRTQTFPDGITRIV